MKSLMENLQIENPQAIIHKLETDLGKESFFDFVRMGWNIVEPEIKWAGGKHIKLMCDYAQACNENRIKNLQINLPTRHAKSYIFCIFLPAWVWISKPSTKFLFASFGEDLALEHSKQCRKLIESEWYQSHWPLMLFKDQNQAGNFRNVSNGFRKSFGVGGAVTGEGGNWLIADDLLKAQDAYSDTVREKVNNWYDGTFSNRIINPKTTKRIVLGQRLHQSDIFGHLETESKQEWEKLILPARYEGKRYISSVGLEDWRTVEGEPLWPELYDESGLDFLASSMSELQVAGQLQQRPTTITGNIFQNKWFEKRIENDQIKHRYIYADTASSVKDTADFSSLICVEIRNDYSMFVREVIRKRIPFYELQSELEKFAEKYQYKLEIIYVEGKANGISLVQNIQKTSPEWMRGIINNIIIPGDKVSKFFQAALYCEKGCVYLPPLNENNDWLTDFFEELTSVPNSKHDDSADAFSTLIIILQNYFMEHLRYKLNRS